MNRGLKNYTKQIQENVNTLTKYKQSVTLKMRKAKIFFLSNE